MRVNVLWSTDVFTASMDMRMLSISTQMVMMFVLAMAETSTRCPVFGIDVGWISTTR